MTGRSKLRWVEIPRHSLRDGLACGEGGVRVMLLAGDDRTASPSPAGSVEVRASQQAPPAEKPR
jgi:hypothetical protein